MNALQKIKQHLKSGQVYRRLQLAQYSNSIDRHLKLLVKDKTLQKLSNGMYYCPKTSVFGITPPEDKELIEAFLKDKDFLISSLNAYNSLGVGTTQLYNEKLVYNRKRDGKFKINGKLFYFIKSRSYPKKSSLEFLLVDLINNLNFLAEDKNLIHSKVSKKAFTVNKVKLMKTVHSYGGVRAKKFFNQLFNNTELYSAR